MFFCSSQWSAGAALTSDLDSAASTGVCTAEDVIKTADGRSRCDLLCSVLLRHVIGHLRHVEHGPRRFMEDREYESVQQMQGSMSQLRRPDPGAFERAQHMNAVKGTQHTLVNG